MTLRISPPKNAMNRNDQTDPCTAATGGAAAGAGGAAGALSLCIAGAGAAPASGGKWLADSVQPIRPLPLPTTNKPSTFPASAMPEIMGR